MPTVQTVWGVPLWTVFVIMSVLSWGAYVPTIHAAQKEMGMAAVKCFFLVGIAYLAVAVLGPGTSVFGFGVESSKPWTTKGVWLGILAGTLGAIGALGIILSIKSGGTSITVPPLVFGFAPLVGIVIGMVMHPPANPIDMRFYLGCLMTAAGTGTAMYYKPM